MVAAPPDTPYRIAPPIPQPIIDGSRYGHPPNLYPYQLQDDYTRERSDRVLQTVELDNEFMHAVFLPELGGRLWELTDKGSGKNLLYSPSTIQFANLALRNAWFAGGIEWNIGTRGHSPTTCSPLHASVVQTASGHSVLRMWEFERLRELVFSVTAWLPAGSRVLFVMVRITNPNPRDVPTYWWSNAAVTQDPQTRVIAPAACAFRTTYHGTITRTAPTQDDGIDCTWPIRNPAARDFFFDLPTTQRPWIMSADAHGDGLAMVSTSLLRGRKLFAWGQGPGGHHWQKWLSPAGGTYFEIQAGLTQTQFEHLRLPAYSELAWTEAYGNARVDPDSAHSADWTAAVEHCESRLSMLIPPDALDRAHATMHRWGRTQPKHLVTAGSGWGPLEALRRARRGETPLQQPGVSFAAEAISEQQRPWLDLLDSGRFAGADSYVAGHGWRALLADAPVSSHSLLHLASMAHAQGQLSQARDLYRRSLELAPTSGAHRGLALVSLALAEPEAAAHNYDRACGLDRANASLLAEAATALLAHGRPGRALALIKRAQPAMQERGRIRFLLARALAAAGDICGAAAILTDGVEVPDIREGEDSLRSLWRQIRPADPVPEQYQFDMHNGGARPNRPDETTEPVLVGGGDQA